MVENATADTWRNLRPKLDRMVTGHAEGGSPKRSSTTADQDDAGRPELPGPARFFDFTCPPG